MMCHSDSPSSMPVPTKRLTSPVPELTNSNDAPLESEAFLVREALYRAEQEILRLDTDIRRTKARLGRLLSQKENLESYVAAHKSVISPVRRAPAEILAEIFMHCRLDPDESTPRPFRSPLLLAQVSSRWRNVALSTPRLWSEIKLNITPRSLGPAVKLMQTWMIRSGGCPLYLNIQCRDKRVDCTPVLNVMMPHSSRWRHVSIKASMATHAALAPVRGCLPLLKSIHLACSTPDETEFNMLNAYELASELREVVMIHPFNPQSPLALPWGQLTRWRSSRPNVEQCLDIIRRTTNLRECTFEHVHIAHALGHVFTVEPHLHLTCLNITFSGISEIEDFFAALTLPALRSLSIAQAPARSIRCPTSSITAFLTRSSSALECLKLDVSFICEDLVRCLMHTPALLELHVSSSRYASCCVNDQLLRRLACNADDCGSCLVPRLRFMRFIGNIDISNEDLVAMVVSRWGVGGSWGAKSGVARLESLHLEFVALCSTSDFIVRGGLEPFRREGMDVSVVYRGNEIW